MARTADQLLHLAHRFLETHRQGAGNDGVADIELFHPLDGRHRFNVLVGESVACIDPQAQLPCPLASLHQLGQLQRLLRCWRIGVATGVQLDPARPTAGTGLQLTGLQALEKASLVTCKHLS